MKAKVQIHRNSKPRKPSKPRKTGEPPTVWPIKRTAKENAKRLAWHAAQMAENYEACWKALFKAQRKLDSISGGTGTLDVMRMHVEEIQRLTKEEAAKCK